jgi:hypothetical protein
MRGHSRPKDGVATLAYDPRIHEAIQRLKPYGRCSLRLIMDCRVEPGNDVRRGRRIKRGPRLHHVRHVTSFALVLSSNTVTTGAVPSNPSSLQRDTTLSYIFLSSLVRGENDLMCL